MTADVVRAYRAFARLEAHGRSPAYEALASAVAEDAGIVRFVASLPAAKRQPNLLFAAARYLLGAPAGIGSLRDLVRDSPAELAAVMRARRTQTNEPARCAVLAGVGVIRSQAALDFIRDKLPGVDVPDDVYRRLSAASDIAAESVRLAGELVRQVAGIPGVAGVHLMAAGHEQEIPVILAGAGVSRGIDGP